MSVFNQCPPKSVQFRCHLLLALTSVLVCTSCVNNRSRASQDFLDLLLQISQDSNDLHGDVALRATACDCLREMEACSPGLLCQRLELLVLSSLIRGPMGSVPTLQTGPDCKELRAVLSSLLEESYLLTPLSQAALLHRLTEVVAMVPGVSPAVFRAQLLRLLGTSVPLPLHPADEECVHRQSVQRRRRSLPAPETRGSLPAPAADPPEKLFYIDCILSFPENRPIGCGDDALPVLLTPRLASVLVPTVFNDSATLLARLHLLCLVYLEEEDEEEEEGRGLGYLYDHLTSLLRIVDNGGSREIVVTFFRAAFLFLSYFFHMEHFSHSLMKELCSLYLRHTHLSPHFINLADHIQEQLSESNWATEFLMALQGAITDAELTSKDLRWHLKMLARVAEEGEIKQQSTVNFLSHIITSSSLCVKGDWRLGNFLLGVCRRLLVHPGLDVLLIPLANVLQHLACRYGDTDIRDHARLYYTLLTTLSKDKLAGVLSQGYGEGGGQAKKRTFSCIVAESEGLTSLLTVHRAKKIILKLVEEPQTETGSGLNQNEDNPEEASLALEQYRAQFDVPGFASEIPLNYQLTHSESADSCFDQLFSIRLHFSLTDDHYEPLGDISVPCVFREKPPPSVKLRLKPRRPQPTSLHASAIFTTQDGLSWLTDLPDVHVAFQQTFLPLPAPETWGRGGRLSLFEGLWDEMSCEEPTGGATSLFCCQLQEEALKTLVEKHFLPYLVSDQSDKEEIKVLFFLPPQSHLLLRICSEETVHFNVATDNWQLLPHINSYLLTLTSSQEDT
ncbi:hypothetical protein F7725_016511 [Dissostichus mawsoni]|uniref:AP-5 complex subunit beta-1 n=1 Tax=Dissostichus mawsoni TaxID=36200 RepID=A0A7J5Z630_DISMA|nr:hypothetical protein F7725_016511 [Dissostichus mawsoni]